MLGLFIGLSFLHFLGDFVCQTKWMASNKSKSLEALTLHVFAYSCTLFIGLVAAQHWTVNDLSRFVVINFILHWVTDCTTSHLTKQALSKREMHQFFAVIGADQFIHTITLMLTGYYFLLPIY